MSYPPPGYDGSAPPGNPQHQPGQSGAGYPPPNAGSVYGTPASGAPVQGGYPAQTPAAPAPAAPAPAPVYHQTAYQPAETPGVPAQGGYPGTTGPVSTPPFSGGPVSSPPASAQPTYATGQSSAPPFGQPMSGPPASSPPYGTPAPASGGAGRKVLVLAIVAGLLFVVGGVMTGLFVAKSSELNRTKSDLTAQVAERDGKIDVNTKEIEKLKQDLQAANDKVKSVEQDLTGTKNDRDEQARQKQVIGKCLDQLTTALAAAAANNRAAYDQAMKGLNTICNEAEKYL
ncbi:hypothetical protein GCM10027290_24700 [Micromonospora sonneratiae]|uniref:Uncharacterized protein n=1 Tax=Micromonospora sonneratiae TaxID=1184706 RepID=A0ABW3YP44_9ACTN